MDTAPRPRSAARARPWLWALLTVSAVGNTVTSLAGDALRLHLALGLVSAACVALLVTVALRERS